MSDRWLSESVAGLKRNRLLFTPVLASHQKFITGLFFVSGMCLPFYLLWTYNDIKLTRCW